MGQLKKYGVYPDGTKKFLFVFFTFFIFQLLNDAGHYLTAPKDFQYQNGKSEDQPSNLFNKIKIRKSLFGEKIVSRLKGSTVTCLPIAGVRVQMKPISSLCGPIICNMTSFVQAASYAVIAYFQVFIAMLLTDSHLLYYFCSATFFP